MSSKEKQKDTDEEKAPDKPEKSRESPDHGHVKSSENPEHNPKKSSENPDRKSNESSVENPGQSDPKLDFYSELFDPLLALRTLDVTLPFPHAKTHDNIFQYKTASEVRSSAESAGKSDSKAGKSRSKENADVVMMERRWLPHQLPTTKTKRERKNLLTRMENTQGPLKLLRECRDKRLRIKVWTRHSHDIRGYCVAYVVAFDKQWNLALEDVEEVWTRPKKRKIPALDTFEGNPDVRQRVYPPPVTIVSSTKKTETCSRHVDQLLIRGEQVALIAVIPRDKDDDKMEETET